MTSYTILVVDDNPENLKTIVESLKEADLQLKLLKAPGGEIAWKLAQKKQPDLIIMDWEMPEPNGIDTIIKLKNIDSVKDIPVIMCSGKMTTSENLKTALEAGAVDYIRKPIDKTELLARVYSMLKLSESYKKIKVLNATKDKFFSIIAHDLNTPFFGLLNLTNFMYTEYETISEKEQKECVQILHETSQTTYNLLQNLLQWAISQRGGIEYKPEYLSVNSLVSENYELMENSSLEKNIQMTANCEPNLEIYADKNMVDTIIRNLLSNAIKFTPEKGRINITGENNGNNTVRLTVTDTGVGIKKEDLPKLFDIEQDFSTKGTRRETGTGLGLIVCKEFIEINKGQIIVESEEDKGATFSVDLPLNDQ